MTEHNSIFYFDFYDSDTDSEDTTVYAFVIDKSLGIDFDELIESDWFDDAFYELEGDYGVHDWSTSPVKGVSSIGYTSYEVDADKQEELVNKWRKEFASNLGEENVSRVVRIGSIDNFMDDLAILNKTEAVLSATESKPKPPKM